MPDLPLYERDPAAWEAHLREGNRTQARKRVGADVLLRDPAGRILLVDPSYKPDWDLPGGMAEANEPPDAAAQREVLEELGLTIQVGRLLIVDWVPPHGPWDDSLMFIFDGGVLTEEQIRSISLKDGEILKIEFVSAEEVHERLQTRTSKRAIQAFETLATQRAMYLHDGTSF